MKGKIIESPIESIVGIKVEIFIDEIEIGSPLYLHRGSCFSTAGDLDVVELIGESIYFKTDKGTVVEVSNASKYKNTLLHIGVL